MLADNQSFENQENFVTWVVTKFSWLAQAQKLLLTERIWDSPFNWMDFAQFIKAQTLINEQDGIFFIQDLLIPSREEFSVYYWNRDKGYKSYDSCSSYTFHISLQCLLWAEVSEIHVYFL